MVAKEAVTMKNKTQQVRLALDKAMARMPRKQEKTRKKSAEKAGGASATNLRGKVRLPENEDGQVLFSVPLPRDLKDLDNLTPIILKWHYEIDYIHSYAQDTPFFAGLANRRLLGTRCDGCGYTYATPKKHCMHCGSETRWVELPKEGRVHSWTTCYFGSQEFLGETPFNLVLVEFEGADTLLLSRLIGVTQDDISVGMAVQAQFKRNSKFKSSDVYFVPKEG